MSKLVAELRNLESLARVRPLSAIEQRRLGALRSNIGHTLL
jgi:hypothetical protein